MMGGDPPSQSTTKKFLSRQEWEEFVVETLQDLYRAHGVALDLIEANDRHIKELILSVSKLVDVVDKKRDR